MLVDLIKQQQAEIARDCEDMKDLLARTEMGTGMEMMVSLPKPALQKSSSEDDIEHFLEMFERTAKQLLLICGYPLGILWTPFDNSVDIL